MLMKRRSYIKAVGAGIAALHVTPQVMMGTQTMKAYVRLGGPVFGPYEGPEAWVDYLRIRGYRAGNCPLEPGVDEDQAFWREPQQLAADLRADAAGAAGDHQGAAVDPLADVAQIQFDRLASEQIVDRHRPWLDGDPPADQLFVAG